MSAPGHDDLPAKHKALMKRYTDLVATGAAYAAGDLNGAPTSTFEIYMGHFREIGKDIEIALSTPIAAPGAGAVTEALAALRQVDSEMRAGFGSSFGETREQVRRAIRKLEAALRPDEAAGQGEAHYYSKAESVYDEADERVATPRSASPVAPDIVPTVWRWRWTKEAAGLDRHSKVSPPWNYTDQADIAVPSDKTETEAFVSVHVAAEALTALSSELAEAKRREDEHVKKRALYRELIHQQGAGFTTLRTRAEAAEAEVARLTHALETATTFSADIKGALEARIEELTAEVARLTRELADVRTNSELRLARLIEANDLLDELRVEAARLTAREKELLEALEPFATVVSDDPDANSKFIWPGDPDHWDAYGQNWGKLIKVAHCRRARALQPAEKDSTDEA